MASAPSSSPVETMTQEIAFKDYYAALQLHLGATSADVQGAYRGLMKEFSGTLDGSARALLAELNEAYHVLASPAFRREYDQLWISVQGLPDLTTEHDEQEDSHSTALPPLAVMAKQHMRARPHQHPAVSRRWLARRFVLALTLVLAFWIMVGAALAVSLA